MPSVSKAYSKSVTSRFSSAAATYNRHANVQLKTAARLMSILQKTRDVQSILEIGCGTGILTKMLSQKFPAAAIDATDISSGMILQSQKHLKAWKNIRWITGDFREMRNSGKYDLVISSSALHWITPLDKTLRMINDLLDRDGILAFGIMLRGTLAELHRARKETAPRKAVQQQLPTRMKVASLLEKTGFRIIKMHNKKYRPVFRSAALLLKSLHEQGVTGGPFTARRKHLTRGELAQLVFYYDKHCNCRGGVFATYEVLHVLARKTLAKSSRV